MNFFIAISKQLTGFDDLPPRLSEAYYHRICGNEHYAADLEMLEAYYNENPNVSVTLESLKAIERGLNFYKGLVFLWYTSELMEYSQLALKETDLSKITREGGEAEEYYGGLLWKVARTHPPGLSGGYFGHWRYEPEN